jgi:signal peptidase I
MEAKLFWISLSCGAYGFLLRRFLRKEERLERWVPTALMHAVFWALVGVVAGSLISSYWEKPELSWKLMGGLGAAGAVLGFGWRALRNRSAEVSWSLLREDLEWADTGFSAILLAAFIMYFFVQAFKIPSGSMRNTLLEGDHLFVNKFVYGTRIPLTDRKILRWQRVERGDVVVFRFPTDDKKSPHHAKDFIKRAIGLPGDRVEIRQKKVYINGKLLAEPYVHFADSFVSPLSGAPDPEAFEGHWRSGVLTSVSPDGAIRDNFGPVTVPPGHYLVLGDNRDHSYDSRFWGPLPDKCLKGRAWFVYLPLKRMKAIH